VSGYQLTAAKDITVSTTATEGAINDNQLLSNTLRVKFQRRKNVSIP